MGISESSNGEVLCDSVENCSAEEELNVEAFLADSWKNLLDGRVSSEFLATSELNEEGSSFHRRLKYKHGKIFRQISYSFYHTVFSIYTVIMFYMYSVIIM